MDDLTIDQAVAEAEKFFAYELARGPKAQTVQERRALLRYANRADVERYLAFYARPWNTGDINAAVHCFACECADPECDAFIDLAITDFPQHLSARPGTRA